MTATILDEGAFGPASEADWQALARKALGSEALGTLASRTEDGLVYGPIHRRRAPAEPIGGALRSARQPWRIVQRIDDLDPERANMQAQTDDLSGANELALVFAGAPSAYGFGLPMTDDALDVAMQWIESDHVTIRVEPHPDPDAAISALRRRIKRGIRLEVFEIYIHHHLDPIGCLAACGYMSEWNDRTWSVSPETQLRNDVHWVLEMQSLDADGRVYHEAGASDAQELGAVLATAIQYFRKLESAGMPLDHIVDAIGFTLSADQKQLLTMAKFRALRLLWSRVLELGGIEPSKAEMNIHAQTSRRMMTALDPQTNIVRTTIATAAAAMGGADSISVLPHTIANGLPDAEARRLARNLQLVLQDEARIGDVADPAAGSGAVEMLTDALAEAGWEEFRRIEAEGGIVTSLVAGALQSRIAARRQARAEAYASGREDAIGVTRYRLESEPATPVLVPARPLAPRPATKADIACPPLIPTRLTESLEETS